MMPRCLREFIRNQGGTALIEFALILPIMITLFFGVFEVTRYVAADMRLANAAQVMADMVAQQTTVGDTSTSMTDFCNGSKDAMYPLSGSSLKVAVSSVTHGSSSTAQDWSDVTCGSATAISNPTTLAASLVPNVNDSVIIVQATYAYTSPISYVLRSSYTLTQTAYARPRNVVTVAHS
jgi:Flp pilus assembly protein TadG